jgi:hypothetical protein
MANSPRANIRVWEGLGVIKTDSGHGIATLGLDDTPDQALFAPRTDELVCYGRGHAIQSQW